MHVVGSVKHERPSLQQMAKLRNLPGFVHWGLSWFHGRFSLLLCQFCASVLLARLSARWRLAIVEEAVRVIFFASSRLVPAHDDMCLVVSDSLRGRSFHAMLKYEGPAFFLSLPLAQFSTKNSGYAWARSKCVTSWCFQGTLQDWLRTNHTNFLKTDSLGCFFRALTWLLSSHCTIRLVLDCYCLCC